MKENLFFKDNFSLSLSRTIFSLKAKSLDIKEFQSWKYGDNGDNFERQIEIEKIVEKRMKIRQKDI